MIYMGLPALRACGRLDVQALTEGGCWVLEEAVRLAAVTDGGKGPGPLSQRGPGVALPWTLPSVPALLQVCAPTKSWAISTLSPRALPHPC